MDEDQDQDEDKDEDEDTSRVAGHWTIKSLAEALSLSLSVQESLCFEILGLDVMLDDDLKPWLLEVNLSPSLSSSEILDLNVKGNLLADLYTLVGVVPNDQRNYEKVRN